MFIYNKLFKGIFYIYIDSDNTKLMYSKKIKDIKNDWRTKEVKDKRKQLSYYGIGFWIFNKFYNVKV